MAAYSDKSVLVKTFLLMAGGKPYGESGYEMLTLDKYPEKDPIKDSEYSAHGFDSGSLRQAYDTREDAETALAKFRSGEFKINPYREIAPENIAIQEIAFDIHAITFTDADMELITVLGAIDCLTYEERQLLAHAFPAIKDFKIEVSDDLPWNTHNGHPPRLRASSYRIASADVTQAFNTLAGTTDFSDIKGNHETTIAAVINKLGVTASFYRSLKDAIEEMGKARLGMIPENDTAILLTRVYDINHTFTPTPPAPPRDFVADALTMLHGKPEPVGQTIARALAARGLIKRPPNNPKNRLT